MLYHLPVGAKSPSTKDTDLETSVGVNRHSKRLDISSGGWPLKETAQLAICVAANREQ
jgi:hypothetical protein